MAPGQTGVPSALAHSAVEAGPNPGLVPALAPPPREEGRAARGLSLKPGSVT